MKKPLVVLALIGAVGYGGVRMFGGGGDDAPATRDSEQLVLDRVWIDHMPRTERDTVQVFLAISEEPFGAFQAASAWRGQYELFRYEARGSELRILYPQTGERETVRHKARRCSEHQMDYCLELDGGSRGVKRYYSRKGWELDGVRSPAAVRERTDAIVQSLR